MSGKPFLEPVRPLRGGPFLLACSGGRLLHPQAVTREILEKLPAEVLLQGLFAKGRIKGLSADEILAALSPEVREALVRRLLGNDSPTDQGGE